jgi:3,2-trans-enoyl-CoA isomerase
MYNVPERQFLRFWADFESLWHTLYLTPIATVAAIESHAPAGGSILALSCDYRVLVETESIRMGLNEAAIGMVAPRWLQAMCANTVGTRNAEFLLQTGMMMTPNEALAYGFVDDTRAPDDVMPRCIEVLEALAPVPMSARHQTKLQQRERIAALAGSSSARELWAVLQSDECKHNLKHTMERLGIKKK